MWASEPEVRAAWEKRQQERVVYDAAELIRQHGFPQGPPPGYQMPPPPQPFPQQAPPPQFPQQVGAPYPGQQPGGPQYPFPLAPQQQLPPQAPVAHSAQGMKQLLIGIALLILGIAITAGTHSAASRNGGGTYVVAYGPIVVGVITIFKGLFNLMQGK